MVEEEPTKSEFTTWKSQDQNSGPPDLRLLHFNDVYHIEAGSAEPIGGISRFQSVVDQYRSDPQYAGQSKLLTLFSGDAYNPSLESSVTKGGHMVPILNGIGTDVACVGNHDLDFGVPQFRHLRNQCNFPWLLANVLDPALGEDVAIANCPTTALIESSNGIKIGVIGLGEREWLDTINAIPPNLIYKSASETAIELVPSLRAQGAEIIIALTHMREPNDLKLAEKTPPGLIDLILGGHDHFYAHHIFNNVHVLRSGTDFKQLSYIEASRKPSGNPGWDFNIIRRDITRSITENPATVELVDKLTSSLKHKLEKPIGYTAVPLDARFTTVRTRESNLGNFVCDLMRFHHNADCALMASGTIRGDQIYPPGVLQLKDIMNCFPFEDPVVVIKVKGKAVWEALENSVSTVPALEGRFLQVSNIQFAYNANLPPGSRILWAHIGDTPLDMERHYTVATRGYMGRGKDGFSSLLVKSEGGNAEELVAEENGILISMIMRQYFMSLKALGKWRRWGPSLGEHWGGVHKQLHVDGKVREPTALKDTNQHAEATGRKRARTIVNDHPVDSDTEDEHDKTLSIHITKESEQRQRQKSIARAAVKKWMSVAGVRRGSAEVDPDEDVMGYLPHWTKAIAPRLEGRIVLMDKVNC